ncbi:hypothetical protein [Nesterenkonia ebinurensis]|uniref:hypothetical protein n=1 Tax=Nesterenkonia ebinurensis TaxID=2608252 RepID=UPI00123D9C97|nr:hypothetical protein [Nesterenkonia ebinurensis]
MNTQQNVIPLQIACPREDGSHSSESLSVALRKGKMLRLRRGVYVPTEAWMKSFPSDRYRLAIAAESLQNPNAVFCRESALSIHDIPLLAVPAQVHLRVRNRGSVRTRPQISMTGSLSAAEFLRRAQQVAALERSQGSSRMLRGFATVRHLDSRGTFGCEQQRLIIPAAGTQQDRDLRRLVYVEPLEGSLIDSAPRLPFAGAIVALDAALRGGSCRPPVDPAHLGEMAQEQLNSQRKLRRFEDLLDFASPLSESPGESLARVRFHELGFAPPQLQVLVHVDGSTYRLDFCWEEVGVVIEFDGWLKYRQESSTPDALFRQEKIREDAIRSTGRTVVRLYWEDLMEPGRRRLVRLLTRAGVPRIA